MGAAVGSAVSVSSSKGPVVSGEVGSGEGKETHISGMPTLAQSLNTKYLVLHNCPFGWLLTIGLKMPLARSHGTLMLKVEPHGPDFPPCAHSFPGSPWKGSAWSPQALCSVLGQRVHPGN